jgi:multiple sugar transport system permease protein
MAKPPVRIRIKVNTILKWILAMVIVFIALFPIWWVISISFSDPGIPVSVNPRLYPSSLSAGIQNILNAVTENNNQFLRAYLNTTLYTVFTILGVLILCSMAAYEFALFEFPGKNILFSLALFAMMIPTVVTLIPTYLLVADLGWINTLQGLVVPGIASAFGLFMLTQFFRDIPREFLDAAVIDGANHFEVYRYIVMPLSTNALVTLAIITFINTWGNFVWPLVIATSEKTFTVSQMINRYNGQFTRASINTIMTVNLLAAILPLLFFIFFQNKIIKGISMSGLKG